MRCDAARKFRTAAISTKNRSNQSSGLIFRMVPQQQSRTGTNVPVSNIREVRSGLQITEVIGNCRCGPSTSTEKSVQSFRPGMSLVVDGKYVLHGKLRVTLGR